MTSARCLLQAQPRSVIHCGDAMKDILLLLVLLAVPTNKVHSLPYKPESNNKCQNSTVEYLNESVGLCCKKCPPGHRLSQECSENKQTTCTPCGSGQYIENWNYTPNCLSCSKCKDTKGLQVFQECDRARNSNCVCKPGMFCVMGFHHPYCSECRKYTVCRPGFRESVPGTLSSDVKCERCPTDPCEPRTTTVATTVAINTILPVSPYPPLESKTSKEVAIVAGVAGSLLFLIISIFLLIHFRRKWTKDFRNLAPKVDANGNCETIIKDHNKCGESQTVLSTSASPEKLCLLEKGEVASDQSLSSNDTETSTRADGFSGHESFRPPPPLLGLDNPTSLLSEPMALQSFTDPIASPPGISTQSSSQPTTPQMVSPVTNSPHVNVNITLHIGNGSCGTPSFQPTDFDQAQYELPLGQEEESVSSPQQEAGKLSLMSVQESPSYCT